MLAVLRRYTRLCKTTQPGIQACHMHMRRVQRTHHSRSRQRHSGQDWFPPPINS